jgi:hypothetical protein
LCARFHITIAAVSARVSCDERFDFCGEDGVAVAKEGPDSPLVDYVEVDDDGDERYHYLTGYRGGPETNGPRILENLERRQLRVVFHDLTGTLEQHDSIGDTAPDHLPCSVEWLLDPIAEARDQVRLCPL